MTASVINRAGTILAHYVAEYAPRRIEIPPETGGFSGAEIVQVECPAGFFCLRHWPDRALPKKRILGLHRLLKTIHVDGVTQVAVPVASLEGSTLLDVAGQFWQLEPWMPGRADFLANPSRERLASAMNCLSRWHTAAKRFQPQPSEGEWFSSQVGKSPAVSERLARIDDWHSGRLDHLRTALHRDHSSPFTELGQEIASLFTAVSPTVADELRSLTQTEFELQPCLRDVWHDHLLFTGNEVTGLIDPAACRTENIATDLSRLLGSLVGDDVAEWDFALECYSQHRHLSHAEHQLIGAIDRSGVLLSGMTWLDRIFLKHARLARPDAVAVRLEGIHNRLRRLV